MSMIYFELALGSSMRLCLKMEEMFPDLQGWQLELMIQLCLVAYNSEIYDGVGRDAWLRTTISLPECNSLYPSIFSEESVERGVMKRIAAAWPTCLGDLPRLHRELAARVQIHSNIVPRDAYREKLLQKLHQHSSVTGQPFRRGFYPIRVLTDAVKEAKSARKVTEDWRNGGRCVLAEHLRLPSVDVPHAFPRDRLREVKRAQVNTIESLYLDVIWKVSWRNGIYVRKSFNFLHSFEKKRDVALRVSHPHIVRPIAQISDMPGHPRLLMEALGSDLFRFAMEQDFAPSVDSLFLSHMDSLDALLQIAIGMKTLHDSNVVHGDLKPQNILYSRFEISEGAPRLLVKIADFDNAHFIVPGRAFEPSVGTTNYAAPEVLKWTRLGVQDVPLSYPKKLDIYSFGSIAYEVLTGQGVYDGQNLRREHFGKVVEGKLPPRGSIEYEHTSAMAACFNKFRKWRTWQWIKMTYPYELVQEVESCWEVEPRNRPTSSELCEVLQRSMSEMQHWEKVIADTPWNYFVPYFGTTICALASRYVNLVIPQNELVGFVIKIAVVMLIVFGCASTTLIVSPLF